MKFQREMTLAAVMLVASGWLASAEAQAQGVLGVTKHALEAQHQALCTRETAFGNVVANALKEEAQADVALIDCAAIKTDKTFPAGSEISMAEASAALPSGKLAVVEVTGAQLFAVLEHGFAGASGDGRFPQISGIRLDVDLKQPAYQRIVKVTVNGAALDFARSYRLATRDGLVAGEQGYSFSMNAKVIEPGTTALSEALAEYVRKEGIVDVKAWGRIEILK